MLIQILTIASLFPMLQDAVPKSAVEEPKPQDKSQERPAIPTDRRGGRVLRVSLEDCLRLGDMSNVDLTLSRLNELLAREDENLADSVFEPEFFAEVGWVRRESPQRSDFQPSVTSKIYSGTIGLRKRIVTGGALELAFSPSYTDQKVNSPFAFPNTFFSGELSFTVSQPLLRGAWIDYNLADLEAATQERLARAADHERARQNVLEAVVIGYYNLVFVREDYVVRYQSLELAREQLRNTEQKIKLGELAPRDRIADQADVAKKEEELITAENAILDAEDELRRLMVPFREGDSWELALVPTDELGPADPEVGAPDMDEAYAIAQATRPDLKASRRRVEAAAQQLLKAKRDLLPGLDLSASYAADAQRDDGADLNRDVFSAEYPDYSLRLALSLPIGNLAARSLYNRAKLGIERAQRSLQILSIDIQKEVREAVRELVTQRQVIDAARESVRLAQNNLDAERTRLLLGDQTQFEVQRRNQELQDARTRLIRARLNYRTAWFHLLAVEGRLDASSTLPGTDPEEAGR